MKRSLVIVAVSVIALISLAAASAGGPFDQKLSPDQQIIQALNRLTFGPRPGEVEEVRRVGVNKWIEVQLHPDQIAENPVIDARLKPLESLRLDLTTVVRDYTPQQNQGMIVMN